MLEQQQAPGGVKPFWNRRHSRHPFDPNELIAEAKGERFREYRRLFHASGRAEIILPHPIDLSIETVDWCNYECPMCPRSLDRGSGARMSDATFDRLIADYAAQTGGLAAVGFDLGEPLLDLHLEDKIRRIHDAGIVDIIVTTNGVFLTPARSQKLIDAGLTKLHVSLDAATQETYTLCRGGDLAAVERNVMEFVRLRDASGRKYPLVRVSYAMIVLNRHEHELFVEKWLPHVDYIEFQESADQSRLDRLVDFETDAFYCHYPFQNVSVTAKGEIQPCCSFYAKHLVFGNLNNGDTIAGVFNDPRTERLRQSFLGAAPIDIVCRNCRFKPPGAPENCEILVPPATLKLKRGPRARE
jgi:radical SAM protein with 4Fe4S-binding SPASM domain